MKTNKIFSLALLFLAFATIYSCKTIPENATAVKPFYKEKYLGKWYEIARIDFKFEKDLNNTTAEYSLKKDGKIKVDNKGYNVDLIVTAIYRKYKYEGYYWKKSKLSKKKKKQLGNLQLLKLNAFLNR